MAQIPYQVLTKFLHDFNADFKFEEELERKIVRVYKAPNNAIIKIEKYRGCFYDQLHDIATYQLELQNVYFDDWVDRNVNLV